MQSYSIDSSFGLKSRFHRVFHFSLFATLSNLPSDMLAHRPAMNAKNEAGCKQVIEKENRTWMDRPAQTSREVKPNIMQSRASKTNCNSNVVFLLSISKPLNLHFRKRCPYIYIYIFHTYLFDWWWYRAAKALMCVDLIPLQSYNIGYIFERCILRRVWSVMTSRHIMVWSHATKG